MTLPKTASLRPGRAANLARVRADLDRRTSAAATPIPDGRRKTPRAMIRQSIRQEYR